MNAATAATKITPMATGSRGQFTATVRSNTVLCREHYRLTLRLTDFPASAPGQFVQLQCRDPAADAIDYAFDWTPGEPAAIEGLEFLGRDAFLRRPFSIAGRRDLPDGSAEIDIIGREVGPGTRFLAGLKIDDALAVIGPLGNTFALPAEGEIALLVGGGVGIPPMIYVAQAIAGRANGSRPVRCVAFAGATTRELLSLTLTNNAADPRVASGPLGAPLFNVEEFASVGVPTVLTTDDGTLGTRGYVTEAIQGYLDAWITDNADRRRTIIYTCGPEAMMKRVQQIAEQRGIRCQIAVERAMACGMGTCQSCCVRVKKPEPSLPPMAGKDWCYRLACTDGPVFGGEELLW